jgi:cardiolipin synthase A/B
LFWRREKPLRMVNGLDVTLIFYGVNIILAVWIVFLERKKPSAVFTWVLVLFFIPWVGFILYIIFGRRPSLWKKRSMEKSVEDRELTERYLERSDLSSLRPEIDYDSESLREHASLVRMLMEDGALLSFENELTLITEGREMFDLLFKDIRNARDHVHVEYFIIRNDDIGSRFFQLLTMRPGRGWRSAFCSMTWVAALQDYGSRT